MSFNINMCINKMHRNILSQTLNIGLDYIISNQSFNYFIWAYLLFNLFLLYLMVIFHLLFLKDFVHPFLHHLP